jgi:hypothetical protein
MRTWNRRAPAGLSLLPGQVELVELPVDSDVPLEILWRAGDGVRIEPDPADPRRVSVCVIDDSAPFARVSWTLVTPPEEYGSVSIRVLRPPAPPSVASVSPAATPLPVAPVVAHAAPSVSSTPAAPAAPPVSVAPVVSVPSSTVSAPSAPVQAAAVAAPPALSVVRSAPPPAAPPASAAPQGASSSAPTPAASAPADLGPAPDPSARWMVRVSRNGRVLAGLVCSLPTTSTRSVGRFSVSRGVRPDLDLRDRFERPEDEQHCSRRQAEIFWSEGRIWIRSLGSNPLMIEDRPGHLSEVAGDVVWTPGARVEVPGGLHLHLVPEA